MIEFTVHSIPGSPFGRAVMIALEEKGASYRLRSVDPTSMTSQEHLLRHPFGRVPVLEHRDYWLYETQAILRYIDRVVQPGSLTPLDPRDAGRMDQVMNVSDWYLFHGVANVIGFHRVVAPRVLGIPSDEAAIEQAMPAATRVFEVLANALSDRSYFSGDAFSLADVLLGSHLDFLTMTPEWTQLAKPHANLGAWLSRMTERPSFKATTWERVNQMSAAA